MDSIPKLIVPLVGILLVIVGIKTMIKRETTLIIRLWSWGNHDNPRAPGGGFSESTQTGFTAFLIGLIAVLTGIATLVQFSKII
jgi:uncharacterized membrane protein YfcA